MEILYISYDGMLEPLGQSQVVSYLRRLSERHSITLISFEKGWDLQDQEKLRGSVRQLQRAGIRWVRLRYHKRPQFLAKIWDLFSGIAAGIRVCLRRKVALIHARGYLPSVMALILKRFFGVKFLFDMRGFWPEERVDAGHWDRRSWIYRRAKSWERRFFEQADGIVSLTRAGTEAFGQLGYSISPAARVEVIPTCVDLDRFSPGPKEERLGKTLGVGGGLVIGCVGNLSGGYLRKETLSYLAFLLARLSDARALFVTQEDPGRLRSDALWAGIPSEKLVITRAPFQEMPALLRWMDLGIFFIQPAFSKRGSAATKLGEFLACGVPVVINAGVGDSDRVVERERVGVVLPGVSERDFENSLGPLLALLKDPLLKDLCFAAARRHFDLKEGLERYLALYAELEGKGPLQEAAALLPDRGVVG